MEFPEEILRAARQMIERHGASATWYAERRALSLTQDQQHAASALWTDIAKAIRTIQTGDTDA